jgi:uncharacterized protein (TIGR02594 family)
MSDFLKKLSRDPFSPIDGASIVSVDELGNGYDYRGTLIAPKFEAPQQTWGETALGVATAPARMATALAGSLSPYGADGWQIPPIVHEGVNALTAVGDAYNYGMTYDEINSRALGMAGFMMGGGGLAARPAGGTGMFAGRLAKTADHEALARAERMAAEGADRNAIWNETGWFQGPDQKWRFEIDDSAASFSPPGSTFAEIYDNASGFKSMGDVLSHQNLYGAYPDTADLGLGISKGDVYGSFGGRGVNDLDIKGSSPRGEAMETLLHEGQHAIQATEGFARGGNRSMFGPDEIAAERARVNTPEPNDWSGIGGGYGDAPDTDVALGLYERLAGEVEARNVQTRMNMSADQRRATPPWETQDIPDIDQIVRLYSNASKEGAIPAIASALEQKGARPEPSANALSSELSGTGFYPLSGGAETGTYLAFDDIPGNAPSPKQQQVRQMAAGHQGRMRSHPGQQAPEGLSSKMGGQELDSSGTPIGSFLDRSHYPRTGLNPIHEVHNWAKVRSMARKAINGEHVPGYLYDGLNGNGNLIAGTHRAAANELLDILGYGKRIKSANINDVLDEPEAYGLSARNADRLRQAAEDGDYRLIDEIWDQSRDTSLFSNSDSRPALLASALGQEEGYADGGSVGLPSPYSIAKTMEGQREGRGNDLLNRFLNGDTAGMTSAEYAWCSRFVKKAAAQSGVDVSGATDMARSWLKVGQPVDDPDLGDVVVLSRGDPNSQYGHVGFYEGTNPDGSVRILSGNHNNAVASASYPSERVLGYRRLGEGQSEAYDPATGQYGMKPLAMVDGVGREPRPLPRPTSSQATEVADSQQSKPSFDLMKLASLFSEPDQAPAPQVQLTPIQAFQSQGAPIQAATPYRATFAHGGQVRGLPDGSEPIHAGPLHSTVPGRTDHLPITVAAGSFVLPADIVSSLGEGNTNAGMETVSQMFPLPPVRRADGGRVPIAAAGGEFVIAPETVAALGNGDLDVGHELLDQFVRRTRAQNIQRLRALPGPEK